jgi:hypothetical protein
MAYYVILYGGLWEMSELAYFMLLHRIATGQEFKMEQMGKRLGDAVDVSHTTPAEAHRLQMEFHEKRRREDPSFEGENWPLSPVVQARTP